MYHMHGWIRPGGYTRTATRTYNNLTILKFLGEIYTCKVFLEIHEIRSSPFSGKESEEPVVELFIIPKLVPCYKGPSTTFNTVPQIE